MKKRKYNNTLLVAFLALLTCFCTVQRSPVTGEKRAYGYSWSQEKKIGAQSSKQVHQQYGVYDNQQLQNYVDNVAQGVLSTSDLRDEGTPKKYRDTKIHYQLLDSPVVNAFALPGGYVYVTRGLMGYLENEAQFAVVVGHETGHVAARHSSQQALQQKLSKFALVGGAIAGQKILGIPGGQILNLGGQAAQLLSLKYSRDDEREADALGTEYAAKQNYKVADAAGFFRSLKRQQQLAGVSLPEWQSTHPDPANRVDHIQKMAQNWKSKGYSDEKENTDKYMHEIDNLVFGKNPRRGFTRNGIFYHPELAFKFPYPSNWKLVNQRSAVQMVNQDGNAIIIFQIDSKNDTPRASVAEFLNQDGIKATGSSAASNNGLEAYEATATGQSQGGKKLGFYLYSLKYDGNVYRFVCYTLSSKFNTHRSQFIRTSNDFAALHDSDILNIKPARLHVFRAPRTAKFESFLPSNLPLDIKKQDVAIANQVALNETINKGDWIKIPRQ